MDFSSSTQNEKESITIPRRVWKWYQCFLSQLLVMTYIKLNKIMKDQGFGKGQKFDRRPLALLPAMHNTSCLLHRCLPFLKANICNFHVKDQVSWSHSSCLWLFPTESIQVHLPNKNNDKISNEVFIKDFKLCLIRLPEYLG